MKYIVQVDIDPSTGFALEGKPEQIQELVGKWEAHNPIGHYFSLTRRRITIIVEADNEDALFEALHLTWDITNSYPSVQAVADFAEFPELLKRVGIGG